VPYDLVPIVFAMLAAACFGGQLILTKRSLAYTQPQTSSMISIGTCLLIFWLLSPFLLRAEYFSNPGMWVFLAVGIFHPLFSLYLAFEATKRMGPTVAATISGTTPLFATAIAVLVMGEHITIVFLMGTIGIIVGIMILSWKREEHIEWALPALLFPLGASALRGVVQNIGKFGLQLLSSPYFACLVTFQISFFGAVLIYRYRMGHLPFRLPLNGVIWSGLSGACLAVGFLSMYAALSHGRVVLVSPIMATFPLYALLISLLFRQERFRLRILIGMILVVGGVIWISIH